MYCCPPNFNGKIVLASLLINPNVRNIYGSTAAHTAASTSQTGTMRLLTQVNIDGECRDGRGISVEQAAIAGADIFEYVFSDFDTCK